MGFRDAISKSPAVGGVIAGVLILAAGWMIYSQSQPRQTPRPSGQWFYSLDSGELFVAALDTIPPTDAPGGGVAVRARVYGCGSCNDKDRKPAILEKYPPKVVETLKSPLPVDPDSIEAEGHLAQRDKLKIEALLIATPPSTPGGDVAWVPSDSSAGNAVREAADDICGDRNLEICTPL